MNFVCSFFHAKICFEVYIKKWVKIFQNSDCQLGGEGGGSGQVGQKPTLCLFIF